MSNLGIAARYATFAAIATALNLAAQWFSFHVYHGVYEFTVGICAGTAAGLIAKYLLDKFLIFDDHSLDVAVNIHKFFYYTLTGAVTTAIFWSTEISFALSGNQTMRYVGALLGLSVGYFIKYHLDRQIVFRATP